MESLALELHEQRFCFCNLNRKAPFDRENCFGYKVIDNVYAAHLVRKMNWKYWKEMVEKNLRHRYGKKEIETKAKCLERKLTRNPKIKSILERKFEEFESWMEVTTDESQSGSSIENKDTTTQTQESFNNETTNQQLGEEAPFVPDSETDGESSGDESPFRPNIPMKVVKKSKCSHLPVVSNESNDETTNSAETVDKRSQIKNSNPSNNRKNENSCVQPKKKINTQQLNSSSESDSSSVAHQHSTLQSPSHRNSPSSSTSKSHNNTKSSSKSHSSSDSDSDSGSNLKPVTESTSNYDSSSSSSSESESSDENESTFPRQNPSSHNNNNNNTSESGESDDSSFQETRRQQQQQNSETNSRNKNMKQNSFLSKRTQNAILGIKSSNRALAQNQQQRNFRLTIPPSDWEKIWNYGENPGFIPGARYSEIINSQIRKIRPSLVFCATKGKRVKNQDRNKSTTATGEKEVYINLNGQCGFKNSDETCPVKVILHCLKKPKQHYPVIFYVFSSGSCQHEGPEFYTRQITGTTRNEIKEKLKSMKPSDVENDMYKSSNSGEIVNKVRPVGPSVVKQIGSEMRREARLDSDTVKELGKRQAEFEKQIPGNPLPGFIRDIGIPCCFALYSNMQLLMFKDLAKKREYLEIHIDATGSIFHANTVQVMKGEKAKNKPMYLYSAVIKGPSEKSILPVFEFATSDHTFKKLRSMMSSCWVNIEDVLKKYHVNVNPVKRVVTDYSFALIKSVIATFNNNMSLGQYLKSVQECVHGDSTSDIQVILALCRSHLVKSACVLMKSKNVNKKKRQLGLHSFVNLMNAESFPEFQMVFEKMVRLFESKFHSSYLDNLAREMTGAEPINETELDNFREQNYTNLEEEVEINQARSTKENPKYLRDFTFYVKKLTNWRKRVLSEVNQGDDEEDGDEREKNEFYSVAIIDALLKVYIPLTPLWASFCQTKFHQDFTSASNGLVEKHFSKVKQSKQQQSRFTPAGFAVKQYSNIQFWLTKSLTMENYQKKTRKRRNNVELVNSSSSEDEPDFPANPSNNQDIHRVDDTDKEVWMARRTKRSKYGSMSGLEKNKERQQVKKQLKQPKNALDSSRLSEPELRVITDDQLTGDLIIKAQNLIKVKNPIFSGLEDPEIFLEGNQIQFQPTKKVIQVLFDRSRGHWVLALANCGGFSFQSSVVVVVDSLFNDLSREMQKTLVSCFKRFEYDGQIHIQMIDCARQVNSRDSGLHALANAFQVALDKNCFPEYAQLQMRQHYVNCISTEQLIEFPSAQKVRPRPLHIHRNCINVPAAESFSHPQGNSQTEPTTTNGAESYTFSNDHDYIGRSYPTQSKGNGKPAPVETVTAPEVEEEPPSPELQEFLRQQDRIQVAYMAFLDKPESQRTCKVCRLPTDEWTNCWYCREFVHRLCGDEEGDATYPSFMCDGCRFPE